MIEKEFELQGCISSGFRWRVKGTGELELGEDREDLPYVPIKRQPRKRPPSGTATVFDLDYDLLLASEREARRQMLAPLAMLPLSYLEKFGLGGFVDPYVASELHRQELRDKELRDVLNALFGKAGDWRVALCIEARRNDHARGELDRAIAVQDDTREVDRFLTAFKSIGLLKNRGPVKAAKAWALYFVLGCRVRGERMPTKGEVLRFLASRGIEVSKKHAARDIFTGPILDCSSTRAAPAGQGKQGEREESSGAILGGWNPRGRMDKGSGMVTIFFGT